MSRLGSLFPQFLMNENRLREELIDFQVTDSKDLSQEPRIDRFWGLVGKNDSFTELARHEKTLM